MLQHVRAEKVSVRQCINRRSQRKEEHGEASQQAADFSSEMELLPRAVK